MTDLVAIVNQNTADIAQLKEKTTEHSFAIQYTQKGFESFSKKQDDLPEKIEKTVREIVEKSEAKQEKQRLAWQLRGGFISAGSITAVGAIIVVVLKIYSTATDETLTSSEKIDRTRQIIIEELHKIDSLNGEIISKPQEKTEQN